MFPIAYHTFETLEEVLRFIGEEDDYRLLAGGTDLMVRYRAGKERAGKLVNLLIPELTGIRETPTELVVGASTSLTSLADAFRPLGEPFSMLCTAAESVGSCQTRNLGTVGGNLCTGNASSDMATALLAADARLTICSRGGERELPLEKFFVRNRVVNLNRGELLKEIRIPKPTSFRTAADFKKLGKRKGHVIAALNLAVVLELDDGGLICHLSGAETKVQQLIREGNIPRGSIAREIYDLLARTLIRMLQAGNDKTGIGSALITGGVAASALLRKMLEERRKKARNCPELVFGKPEMSGDNAVGVALIGAKRFINS